MEKKQLRFNNTYESGSLTFLVLRDTKTSSFLGICLEFDLEAEGTTAEEAQSMVEEYAKAWLENVRENKLSEELLNKETLKEYWNIIREIEDHKRSQQKMIEKYASSVTIPVLSVIHLYSPKLPFKS